MEIALLGDSAVRRYSVTDRLWELISIVTNTNIKFSLIPAATGEDARKALDILKANPSYAGIHAMTLPYNKILASSSDIFEEKVKKATVDTMYRNEDGALVGVNTMPIGIQRALEAETNLYMCHSVLVISAEGAGRPIAEYMQQHLGKETYLYDPASQDVEDVQKGTPHTLQSLNDLTSRTYDVIINATPLGRYYLDKRVEAFTSPLDLDTLKQVAKPETVVLETNCLPANTLLLQMARHLELQVVTGDFVLVCQELESLRRFSGITIADSARAMLVEELAAYIAEREAAALE